MPHAHHKQHLYDDDEQLSTLDRMKTHSAFWYTMIALTIALIAIGIAYGPSLVARYMPETYDLLGGNGDRNYDVRGTTPGALPPVQSAHPKQAQHKQSAPIERKANQ